MQKWEYLTLDSASNYGTTKFYVNGDMQPTLKNMALHDIINQLGGQGWELVGVAAEKDARTYIFKRMTDKAPSASKQKPPA